MLPFSPDFAAVCLFVLFFVLTAFRCGQFQWLWFSICLWLGIGLLSAQIMPRVLGVTHLFNLYPAHFYVFVGSIFFWLNHVEPQPETEHQAPRSRRWQSREGAVLPVLLALSLLVQHLAFAILCLMTWLQYPDGLSGYLTGKLLSLYLLEPLHWHLVTLLLMAVFYGHRRLIMHQRADRFGTSQIYGGLLLALSLQFFYLTGGRVWLAWLYRILIR